MRPFLFAAALLTASCSGSIGTLPSTTTTTTAPTSLVGRVVVQGTTTGIAGAQLTLVYADPAGMTTTTDATGAFEYDNLAAGSYTLQAVATGYETQVSTLKFPVDSYTVQMPPRGASAPASIVSVSVSGPGTVRVGGTVQMTATALFTDGSQRNVTNGAKWSSSDTTISLVNSTGLVTAYKPGGIVVTAAYDSTVGSTTVTITP